MGTLAATSGSMTPAMHGSVATGARVRVRETLKGTAVGCLQRLTPFEHRGPGRRMSSGSGGQCNLKYTLGEWPLHSVASPVGSATTLPVEEVGEEGDHGDPGRVGRADLQ